MVCGWGLSGVASGHQALDLQFRVFAGLKSSVGDSGLTV